jgi:hypothetical protein
MVLKKKGTPAGAFSRFWAHLVHSARHNWRICAPRRQEESQRETVQSHPSFGKTSKQFLLASPSSKPKKLRVKPHSYFFFANRRPL